MSKLYVDELVGKSNANHIIMPKGSVVQTVYGESTTATSLTSTTKGSGTETGVEVTITPHSSSNKLLIQANIQIAETGYVPDTWIALEIHDGSSIVYTDGVTTYYHNASGDEAWRIRGTIQTYIDAPSSATTYKVRAWRGSSGTFTAQNDSNPSSIVIQEIQQ